MFQTHNAHSERGSLSQNESVADSSERLRASVSNQDVMDYQRRQNNRTNGAGSGSPEVINRVNVTGNPAVNDRPPVSNKPGVTGNPGGYRRPTARAVGNGRPTERAVGNDRNVQPNDKPPGTTVDPSGRQTINFDVVATPQQFRERVQRIFGELDINHNGYLTRAELGKAVEDHRYEGADAQVVAGLFNAKSFNGLVNVSKDQQGKETALSRKDVEMMDIMERSEPLQTADAMVPWATKNFAILDLDNNGFIDFSELDDLQKVSEDPKLNKQIELLKENYDVLQNAHNDEYFWENDGITRSDLQSYLHTFKAELVQNELQSDGLFNALWAARRTRESQNGTSDELYGNGSPRNSIDPDAIKQGTVGDCYFLAALASVAETNPAGIQRMIKDNKDGTYTVTFEGDREHPITVAAPTEAEQGLYNGGSRFGTWAGVMERAFGKWRIEQGNSKIANPATAVEAAGGGDSGAFAMRILTGHKTSSLETKAVTNAEIAADLDFALNRSGNRSAVTAGIYAGEGHTKDGWYRDHLYSIIAFEPGGKEGGWVTIRNPWGAGENSRNGTRLISLNEFKQNFDAYYIERNPKHAASKNAGQ
jgi:Ca2+-binding EF-hand superfamily protein